MSRLSLITTHPPMFQPARLPVRVYCLGRFSVLINDQPLRFGHKSQRRPLELLKLLIAHGGRAVPDAVVLDELWPEADGDAAYSNYTTTVHRLRRLLKCEQAILRRNGEISLDNTCCWVDVWAFERLVGSAMPNRAPEAACDDATLSKLEQAVALYHGPFLAQDFERDSTSPLRLRLQSKYLRAQTALARHWQHAGDWDRAVDCYLRGLEVDDLAETLYQGLMMCYLAQGRQAEGIAVYRRCQTVLRNKLKVEPSARTLDLAERIRSEG